MYTYIQAGTMKGATDAEQIQNAIAEAKSNGTNRVVISRHNDRTGADIWNIDRTVFLPDDIELLIDNAHLRLADGAFCNMFSNENITKDISHTTAGEQKNITLRGIGNAILDGGTYNGLSEKTACKTADRTFRSIPRFFSSTFRDFASKILPSSTSVGGA